MTLGVGWFDALLAALLPLLAWQVLAVRDLFRAVVLFIVFGLLLALVWVRLQAPDVALAEAIIGAGLTGALFLSALGRLQNSDRNRTEAPQSEPTAIQDNPITKRVTRSSLTGNGLTLASLTVAVVLGWAVLTLSTQATGLAEKVQVTLKHSGVTNPVTAVLLNFRGYDTLLEIGVLLLAVCGVWSLSRAPTARPGDEMRTTSPVLQVFVQFFAPIMVIVGGYLLWAGAHAPGGAFQGGAVISAMVVVLLLSGMFLMPHTPGWLLRALLIQGFVFFLAVAVGVMGVGNRFLQYPQEWAGVLILLIETTLTLSIAAILASLFASSLPDHQEQQE
jgi:multisubunit Na+/H+ antiporter MnhB subunit